MANLRLENVSKRFGPVEAVKGLDLEIRNGEFFCILGPPGAGKTTTLRLIVGLEKPDTGTVYIEGRPANERHPGQRDIAMIFQNLALYPDKTVFDNIAFPLRERKLPKAEIETLVTGVAKTLRIERLLKRKPGNLSGGERQRVAIGRAIVRRPQAYLMDEPLANLDAMLRREMRVELKRLQQELGQTLVYVTHDQIEALSMANRIAVLNRGVLQQCDTPDVIYNFPANRFVATVIGSPPMNCLPCTLQSDNGLLQLAHPAFTFQATGANQTLEQALDGRANRQNEVLLGIRPEDIRVFDAPADSSSLPAQVSVLEPLGAEIIVDIALGPHLLKAVAPPTQKLNEGQKVWLNFDLSKIHVLDAATEMRLYTSDGVGVLDCRPR